MADLSLVFDLLARDRASSEVAKVGDSMDAAGDQADGFGDRVSGMFGMLAGAAAGAGLAVGAAFAGALEAESSQNMIGAQLGLPPELAAEMGAIAGSLYAQNYGESVADTTAAIRSTMQSGLLPEDATNAQIESITARTLSLATAMGVDVGEAANAAGQMMQTGLAANADEALDLVARGMQQGADRGGDLLDVLGEYGTTFAEVGLSGADAVGLINQAVGAGIPNADFAADALREMGIIGREAGEDASDALESIGLNAGDYFAAMQEGGPAAAGALDQVLDALRNTEDPALRSAAATALVGTQYEDLGDAILAMDPSAAAKGLGTIEGAAANLDATLAQGIGPTLSTFARGLQTTATEGMTALLAGFTQGKTDAEGWQGTVQNAGATLSGVLLPALGSVSGFVTGTALPALGDLFGFLAEHQTTVGVIAGIIGGVLVLAFVRWGIQAGIAAGLNALAWLSGLASSVAGAAGMVLSATAVVGSWLLMGAQALLAAGRMALAWFIALGPIGWVIAAIVGIGLIVWQNWDAIVTWTSEAWSNVTRWVGLAWDGIKALVQAGVDWLVSLFLNWTGPGLIIKHWDTIKTKTMEAWEAIKGAVSGAWNRLTATVSGGIDTLIGFVSGLPSRVLTGLGNLSSLLVSAGGDLLRGLQNGITNAVKGVVDAAKRAAQAAVDGVKSLLGIASPSKVMQGIGVNMGEGLALGIADMRPAVAAELAALADVQALGSLAEFAGATSGGALGYRAPAAYDAPAGGPAGAGGATHTTYVTGVVGPEEVAAIVARSQATTEFLAGAGS